MTARSEALHLTILKYSPQLTPRETSLNLFSMSGHNKWSKIKRKKGASDAKKSKAFSKVIREITVAARFGGADPDGNPRLRLAMDKAREANMPNDNVQRAIQKGAGGGEGTSLEEFVLEGYGPGGSALLVEVLTDNHNRSVSDIRHIISKHGGSLGAAGCVNWMFNKKGVLTFDKSVGEEQLMEVLLEAGADDIQEQEDLFEATCPPYDITKILAACQKVGIKPAEAGIQMIPQSTVHLNEADAGKILKLMELLEENDDVQNVHSNFDMDESLMEKLTS